MRAERPIRSTRTGRWEKARAARGMGAARARSVNNRDVEPGRRKGKDEQSSGSARGGRGESAGQGLGIGQSLW